MYSISRAISHLLIAIFRSLKIFWIELNILFIISLKIQ